MTNSNRIGYSSRTTPAFSKLVIVRGACYGPCPVYSVMIKGDGAVVYKGREFVIKTGRHVWTLPASRIRAIAAAINDSMVLDLHDSDANPLPDSPQLLVSIRMADGGFRNLENVEDEEVLEAFAARIDKLADLDDYRYWPQADDVGGGDHDI